MISDRDAAELEWFFSQGQRLLGSSVTGVMLARSELHSVRIPPSPETWAAMLARRPNEPPPDALTVRSTANQPTPAASYVPSDSGLQTFARISRRLGELPDHRALAVLAAYYGDAGARWALDDGGRIVAVMALTRAGQRLADGSRGGIVTTTAERIASELVLQKARANPMRAKLIEEARRHAWKALEWACRMWSSHGQTVQHHGRRKDAHIVE